MTARPASGLVAVMVTDLVGSTSTLQRIGEDENDRLRRTHFALLRSAVTQHGGTEVKTMGDGILAVFGSPSSALAAAGDIQRAAHRHNLRGDAAPLHIRVGVHAGEAIQDEDDWFGEPVVVASRLCARAEGGETLLSDLVRALLGRRGTGDLVSRGEVELKGLDEPVTIWAAAWSESEAERRLPAGLTSSGTWVGRDVELDVLARTWKAAAAGRRQVVLMTGEPGVGKTRLASELAARVHDRGCLVLYGRCDEETPTAYQPFVEALRRLLEQLPAAVESVLDLHASPLASFMPELRGRATDVPVADPDAERQQLFEAATALLTAASTATPILFVLDDLHWAAKPTLLLLRNLARSVDQAALMILGTYRDTDLDRAHPLSPMLADLRRVEGVERLSLSGLDTEGVTAFLAAASGQTLDAQGVALAKAIHDETEGNPFFVGEVLRHLVESGALVRRDGRWTSDRSLAELGIPEGVREVVGRRLSRLSEAANQLLAVGSLVGREFDLDLATGVAELSEDDALDAADEAAAAGVISEVRGRPGRYSFSHALVQDTLATELSSARRVRLHRRIATALETLHATNLDPWLGALARHHAEGARAGGVERAVHYAVLAGNQAIDRLAFEDAAAIAERAAQVLELDDDPDPALALEVALVALEARRRMGPSRIEPFLHAVALARRVGTSEAIARVAVYARHNGNWGEHPLLLEAPMEALAALPESDSVLRARVLSALAYVQSVKFLPEAPATTAQAFELALRVNDVWALTAVATISVFDGKREDLATQDRMSAALLDVAPVLGPLAAITAHYIRCFSYLARAEPVASCGSSTGWCPRSGAPDPDVGGPGPPPHRGRRASPPRASSRAARRRASRRSAPCRMSPARSDR